VAIAGIIVSQDQRPKTEGQNSIDIPERIPLGLAIAFDQGVDHRGKISGDHVFQIEILIDAVVGEAVLREVVGANAFVAIAGADLLAALG
jgi:hypothetical protein